MNDTERVQGLASLREPFPPEVVGKLPRNIQKNADKRSCNICGGYHAPAGIHLDYVGHAEVTDRLLSVDPEWTWEPFSTDERGLPVFIHNQQGSPIGLWIKLTVLGVTRPGYGSVEAGKAEAVKELIGDALRNAAMRFGVALTLWAKSELESQVVEGGSPVSGETAAAHVSPPSQDSPEEAPASQHVPSSRAEGTSGEPSGSAGAPPSYSETVRAIGSYIGGDDTRRSIVVAKIKALWLRNGLTPPAELKDAADYSVLDESMLAEVVAELQAQEVPA